MSRFRYRFTLHQLYAHYAKSCNLNWRDMALSARVSSRTLLKYFESTDKLADQLVDYHLKYLNHYYTAYRIGPSKSLEEQFRRVRLVVARHKDCYHFTENAWRTNLAGRGQEVKELHLNYIRNAMLNGGVAENRILPEMVFNFFLTPIPEGKNGNDLLFHWMSWFKPQNGHALNGAKGKAMDPAKSREQSL